MLRTGCVSALVLLLASVGAQGRVSRELLQDAGGQTIMQGQISAYSYHTCSIKSDGLAWCWGYNLYGQLGDGSTSNSPTPVEVLGGGTWLQISTGATYTCGLKTDNTAWCWGYNLHGQLGNGGTEDSSIPSPVAGGGTWLQITCGEHHTCGIKTDGSAWCWGYNYNGQLGNPIDIDKSIPTIVSGGGTWLQISAGGFHTCGIKEDSSAWCWGSNYNSELINSPTVVDSSATWLQISAGVYHTCGIQSDQSACCWAQRKEDNYTGPIMLKYLTTPTAIPGRNFWLQISVGKDLICGITSDFSAWCWGNNNYGQAGDGSSGDAKSTPVKVYGGYSWQEVSAGWEHACGITQQGEALCWGSNSNNEDSVLGSEGPFTNIPRAVASDGPWGVGGSAPSLPSAPPPLPLPLPLRSPPSPEEDLSPTPANNISPSPQQNPPPPPPNIGAIVGGVVGGVAVLAAITAFIVWRKRRSSTAPPPSTETSTLQRAPTRPEESVAFAFSAFSLDSNYLPSCPEDSAARAQYLSSLPSLPASADPVLQWVATYTSSSGDATHQRSLPRIPSNMKHLAFTWPAVRLLKSLGKGSFGQVYLGTLNHSLVALKLLIDADNSETAPAVASYDALIAEASILASLRHPNVALLVGYCLDPPCLALEVASRGSLLDVFREAAANPIKAAELTWHRRLGMAADAAAGMLHLHTRSPPILHRDLKSPNLLVTEDWKVKVTDMGLSKVVTEASLNASATNGGVTNPRWLAPEVLNGARATAAADVFSFGVVMWELLTWKLPWADIGPRDVRTIERKVREGSRLEVPALNELPGERIHAVAMEAYVGLMRRCWAQVPEDRPSFEVVASELRAMGA